MSAACNLGENTLMRCANPNHSLNGKMYLQSGNTLREVTPEVIAAAGNPAVTNKDCTRIQACKKGTKITTLAQYKAALNSGKPACTFGNGAVVKCGNDVYVQQNGQLRYVTNQGYTALGRPAAKAADCNAIAKCKRGVAVQNAAQAAPLKTLISKSKTAAKTAKPIPGAYFATNGKPACKDMANTVVKADGADAIYYVNNEGVLRQLTPGAYALIGNPVPKMISAAKVAGCALNKNAITPQLAKDIRLPAAFESGPSGGPAGNDGGRDCTGTYPAGTIVNCANDIYIQDTNYNLRQLTPEVHTALNNEFDFMADANCGGCRKAVGEDAVVRGTVAGINIRNNRQKVGAPQAPGVGVVGVVPQRELAAGQTEEACRYANAPINGFWYSSVDNGWMNCPVQTAKGDIVYGRWKDGKCVDCNFSGPAFKAASNKQIPGPAPQFNEGTGLDCSGKFPVGTIVDCQGDRFIQDTNYYLRQLTGPVHQALNYEIDVNAAANCDGCRKAFRQWAVLDDKALALNIRSKRQKVGQPGSISELVSGAPVKPAEPGKEQACQYANAGNYSSVNNGWMDCPIKTSNGVVIYGRWKDGKCFDCNFGGPGYAANTSSGPPPPAGGPPPPAGGPPPPGPADLYPNIPGNWSDKNFRCTFRNAVTSGPMAGYSTAKIPNVFDCETIANGVRYYGRYDGNKCVNCAGGNPQSNAKDPQGNGPQAPPQPAPQAPQGPSGTCHETCTKQGGCDWWSTVKTENFYNCQTNDGRWGRNGWGANWGKCVNCDGSDPQPKAGVPAPQAPQAPQVAPNPPRGFESITNRIPVSVADKFNQGISGTWGDRATACTQCPGGTIKGWCSNQVAGWFDCQRADGWWGRNDGNNCVNCAGGDPNSKKPPPPGNKDACNNVMRTYIDKSWALDTSKLGECNGLSPTKRYAGGNYVQYPNNELKFCQTKDDCYNLAKY